MTKEQILSVIYEVADLINQDLPANRRLNFTEDMVLFGREGQLDSLGLINFIVALEQKIEEKAGVFLTLADQRAMSQTQSPFRTIGTLAEYICLLLEKSDAKK